LGCSAAAMAPSWPSSPRTAAWRFTTLVSPAPPSGREGPRMRDPSPREPRRFPSLVRLCVLMDALPSRMFVYSPSPLRERAIPCAALDRPTRRLRLSRLAFPRLRCPRPRETINQNPEPYRIYLSVAPPGLSPPPTSPSAEGTGVPIHLVGTTGGTANGSGHLADQCTCAAWGTISNAQGKKKSATPGEPAQPSPSFPPAPNAPRDRYIPLTPGYRHYLRSTVASAALPARRRPDLVPRRGEARKAGGPGVGVPPVTAGR